MRESDITYQDKLNELRLDITHPNSQGINFVLVEGDSDIRLFRKIFDNQTCKVEKIPGGNPKVEECVGTLCNIYPLLIGVRDADFLHLSNDPYIKKNMFLTDKHDIEMTMLNESTILNSLVFEFTSKPIDEHVNFQSQIIQSIKMISYFKWLNVKESLGLSFKKIGFQDLICCDSFTLDFSSFFSRLIAKQSFEFAMSESEVLAKIDTLKATDPDMLQLTNGHDILKAFSLFFREKEGCRGMNDDIIASSFRMGFSLEHFKSTSLFNSLRSWETDQNTNLFKESA